MERDMIDKISEFRYKISFDENLFREKNAMSPFHLAQQKIRVEFGEIVNVNGWGVGQVHIVNDSGVYLMLPWCCIVSIIPLGPIKK